MLSCGGLGAGAPRSLLGSMAGAASAMFGLVTLATLLPLLNQKVAMLLIEDGDAIASPSHSYTNKEEASRDWLL